MTIIDTDILIDAGRGVQEAVDCLNVIAASMIPTISVVTQMELIVGCRNKSELQKLAKFLDLSWNYSLTPKHLSEKFRNYFSHFGRISVQSDCCV